MAKKEETSKIILERVYVIPLRRETLKVPNFRKANKAVKAIREFISKHMKSQNVAVGKYLNLKIWNHGAKNPPGKIKVNAATLNLEQLPQICKLLRSSLRQLTPEEWIQSLATQLRAGKYLAESKDKKLLAESTQDPQIQENFIQTVYKEQNTIREIWYLVREFATTANLTHKQLDHYLKHMQHFVPTDGEQ